MIVFDFKLPRIEILGLWEDADTVKGCPFFEYRLSDDGLDREIWLGRLQIIISSTRPRVTPLIISNPPRESSIAQTEVHGVERWGVSMGESSKICCEIFRLSQGLIPKN